MSRAAADRLLDSGPGPEPLRHLLTVAAGPAQWDELHGEEAARLAFTASACVGMAPDPGGHRGPETVRTLSRIMAAKAIAVVALTVGAGGVAVAATTNSLGDGSLGSSTGQKSKPATTDPSRTLVVDQMSDRRAEPLPTTIDTHQSAGFGGRPGSCQGDAEDHCGAPTTTVLPAPANRKPAAPVADTPADIPSNTNHPSARSPSSEPPGPARETNHRTADSSADKTTSKKQPPGQGVNKTDQNDKKSRAGTADED